MNSLLSFGILTLVRGCRSELRTASFARRTHRTWEERRFTLRTHFKIQFVALTNVQNVSDEEFAWVSQRFQKSRIGRKIVVVFPRRRSVLIMTCNTPAGANIPVSMLTPATSFSLGAISLIGRSRAGDGTSFYIPELRWMFDAGALVTASIPQTLFLTHTHSDHVQFLTRLIQSTNDVDLTIYLPEQAVPLMSRHIDAYLELIECGDRDYRDHNRANLNYSLHSVQPDREFTVKRGGNEYIIQPIECTHRIVCYGYSIYHTRQRLRAEYSGLSGRDIGMLKKQGVHVTESLREPLLCILGDTTHGVFEKYPNLPSEQPVIVVECSFLDTTDQHRAAETKHMHWEQLREVIEQHPNTMFLLTHFSLKYSSLRLRRFFCEIQTEQGMRNVHPMLIQAEVTSEWNKAHDNGEDAELEPPTCQCRHCNPTNK